MSDPCGCTRREAILKRPLTDYSHAKELVNDFEPFCAFWAAAGDWKVGGQRPPHVPAAGVSGRSNRTSNCVCGHCAAMSRAFAARCVAPRCASPWVMRPHS